MSVLTSATLTRAVTELPSVAKLTAGATAFILNYLTNVVYFILLSLPDQCSLLYSTFSTT